MIKHIFLVIVCVLAFSPVVTHAAFNDVAITAENTVITVGGVNLNISGTNTVLETLTVEGSNFSFTMQDGSIFAASSTDRYVLSPSDTSMLTTDLCTANASSLGFTATASTSVTITPSSSATCSGSATVAGGGGGVVNTGGGGGGGGGGGTPSTPVVVVTTPQPTPVQEETTTVITVAPTVTAPSAITISPVFTKLLKKGSENADIKRLQQLLNSDPDTQVAASGVGSSGNETNYFGSLTTAAVQKFQAKYGIVSSGTPETTGYGLVGPATRAKLAVIFGGIGSTVSVPAATVAQPSPVAISVSPVFTGGLSRGMSNSDIKRLQQLLNSDTDTRVAASGVGSSGNETNYFGSLTEKAVQKFQEKYGVAGSDDPGYGYVGPKTRAKLGEVFSGIGAQQPTTPAPAAPTPSASAQEAALQAQLETLKAQLEQMMAQLREAQNQ